MKDLFSEFKPNNSADWKDQIMKDLKGGSFEDLVWHTENGFDVQPFYTAEDLKEKYNPAFTHSNWDIGIQSPNLSAAEQNKFLLHHLNRGSSAIMVNVNDLDLDIALKDIKLNFIQSSFITNSANIERLLDYMAANYDERVLQSAIFPNRLETKVDLADYVKTMMECKAQRRAMCVTIDALPFHNQNITAVQEVALIVAILNDVIESLRFENYFPSGDLVIRTGVNSDFFTQIAKFRAIRRIWFLMQKEFDIKNGLRIIAETGLTNKTISDAHNNLLRSTVEAMAAVAGGCNELHVTNFDVFLERDKTLSQRMAINQQLILKEEVFMDKMADVACGSYYIESLTDQIGDKAFELFKYYEKKGGYFECMQNGIISSAIKQEAKLKAEEFDLSKKISIGVNKFRNEKEQLHINSESIQALMALKLNNSALNFELKNFFNS